MHSSMLVTVDTYADDSMALLHHALAIIGGKLCILGNHNHADGFMSFFILLW